MILKKNIKKNKEIIKESNKLKNMIDLESNNLRKQRKINI